MAKSFYKKFKEFSKIVDSSNDQFLVASIGKQSLGKSYFLSRIFSRDIPTKDKKLVEKGTHEFHYKKLDDFHLFDMEGFEGKSSSQIRDIFNLYAAMSISNVIILHVSHQDLENYKFIRDFSFSYYQCFSPFKKTCFEFTNKIPIIILLIRNPIWDIQSVDTVEKYEILVRAFEAIVNQKVSEFFNKFIDLIKEADLKNDKENAKKIKENAKKIKENYEKTKSLKVEFKLEKHYIIYFEEVISGNSKNIQYFQLKMYDDDYDIRESDFLDLKNDILHCKNEYISNKNASPFKNDYLNENEFVQSKEILYEIIDLMVREKNKRESKLSIIKNIYIEIKHDIFKSMETYQSTESFIKNYYKIKKQVDNMIGEQSKYVIKLNINPDTDSRRITESQEFKSKRKEMNQKFSEIIQEVDLGDYEKELFMYYQILTSVSFQSFLELNESKEKQDSLVFTTLYCIINFDDQNIINEHIIHVKKQLLLYESLCFYSEKMEKILKTTYSKYFRFYDVVISLVSKLLKNLENAYSRSREGFTKSALKILNTEQCHNNMKIFFLAFEKYLKDISAYQQFILLYRQLSENKIIHFCSSGQILVVDNRKTKIKTMKLEKSISVKNLFTSLIPSLSGLLVGIVSLIVRAGIMAGIESAAAAISVAAATAWIPIVGWTIFGVTTLATLGWLGYEIWKTYRPIKLQSTFRGKEGYEIEVFSESEVINGYLEDDECKRVGRNFYYSATLKKKEQILNSALATVYFTIVLTKLD